MKARLLGLKPFRFNWGRIAFIALFSLVLLMLFTGYFSKGGRAKDAVGSEKKDQLYGLAAIDALAAGGLTPQREDSVNPQSVTNLIPGDILVGRCALSPVPSLNPVDGWTHACIYIGNDWVVVAGNPQDGVRVAPLSFWMYPDMTWVAYLRVVSADAETRQKAVEFALSKQGEPYDINWFSKQAEGGSWYCSELVWAAYLNASEGRIDLSRRPDVFGVSPDEIYQSSSISIMGGHYERKPDTISSMLMKAIALCLLAGGVGVLLPQSLSPPLIPRDDSVL